MSFFVAGKPIPQGSMKAFGKNLVHSSSKELNAWRDAIGWTAKAHFKEPLEGAVMLIATFYLPKPKSAKRDLPFVKPDLDKLIRAVGDALTGIAYIDDSQITHIFTSKIYGEAGGARLEVIRAQGGAGIDALDARLLANTRSR